MPDNSEGAPRVWRKNKPYQHGRGNNILGQRELFLDFVNEDDCRQPGRSGNASQPLLPPRVGEERCPQKGQKRQSRDSNQSDSDRRVVVARLGSNRQGQEELGIDGRPQPLLCHGGSRPRRFEKEGPDGHCSDSNTGEPRPKRKASSGNRGRQVTGSDCPSPPKCLGREPDGRNQVAAGLEEDCKGAVVYGTILPRNKDAGNPERPGCIHSWTPPFLPANFPHSTPMPRFYSRAHVRVHLLPRLPLE